MTHPASPAQGEPLTEREKFDKWHRYLLGAEPSPWQAWQAALSQGGAQQADREAALDRMVAHAESLGLYGAEKVGLFEPKGSQGEPRADSAEPERVMCSYCQGSGEALASSWGRGPDDDDHSVTCGYCGGTGIAPGKWLKDSTQAERSFPEDEPHENGNYMNTCRHCQRVFIGHKRRFTCKVCVTSPPQAGPHAGSAEPSERETIFYSAKACRARAFDLMDNSSAQKHWQAIADSLMAIVDRIDTSPPQAGAKEAEQKWREANWDEATVGLWQAMNDAEKFGNRTDDKGIYRSMLARGLRIYRTDELNLVGGEKT